MTEDVNVSPSTADLTVRLDLKAIAERWIDIYDEAGNYYATIKVQRGRLNVYHSRAVRVHAQPVE